MEEYCRPNTEISPPILDIDDEEQPHMQFSIMYFIRKMCRKLSRSLSCIIV